jgi:hypothetical protein
MAMTLSGRAWPVPARLARIDIAAGVTIVAALSFWLAWH